MNIYLPNSLFCFSHLRWDFVYQRPQHLMSRFSAEMHVYYMEEPIFEHQIKPYFSVSEKADSLWVYIPHLPLGLNDSEISAQMNQLLSEMVVDRKIDRYIFWYYTPMALKFTEDFTPLCLVYDCMDELSAFNFAPPELKQLEQRLFSKADIVFTGGSSLYEAKRQQHTNIYLFPSSIDKQHFQKARQACDIPADQSNINGFKIGFYGVLDERFDAGLIAVIADQRPAWQIILIGPIVKIDPSILPQRANIHYLGAKNYNDLPAYLSGWDVALIPFLLNGSTQYISPTKTPEYLAGGKPVVSTPIRDVISSYADHGLVSIGSDATGFISIIDKLALTGINADWMRRVDSLLAHNSWEHTFAQMNRLLAAQMVARQTTVNILIDENDN